MQGDLRKAIHFAKQTHNMDNQAPLTTWLKQAEQRLYQEEQLELLSAYTDHLVS